MKRDVAHSHYDVRCEGAKTTPLVRACEEGHVDGVKELVEGHDVEKTGMSVDDMVSAPPSITEDVS